MFIGLEAVIFAGMFLCAAGTVVRFEHLRNSQNYVTVLDFLFWLIATIILLFASLHGKV